MGIGAPEDHCAGLLLFPEVRLANERRNCVSSSAARPWSSARRSQGALAPYMPAAAMGRSSASCTHTSRSAESISPLISGECAAS